MFPMSRSKALQFTGFQIGAFITSVLLAGAIRLFVETLTYPLAATFVGFWNSTIVHTFPNTSLLPSVFLSWILLAYTGVSALVLLVSGLKLATWVSKEARSSR
jgi:hypothetical protein